MGQQKPSRRDAASAFGRWCWAKELLSASSSRPGWSQAAAQQFASLTSLPRGTPAPSSHPRRSWQVSRKPFQGLSRGGQGFTLPLRLYSASKCQFVEMSGDAVSGEASTIYNIDEVVEPVLGSARLGLGSSHVQKHTRRRDGAGSCGSVTSHKTQGPGFSEGIWHLGELRKAGGKVSIALKAFVSN